MSSSVATLLEELVAIASPSGSEREAADFAETVLRRGGADVERLGDTVLARLDFGPGPSLLFNSHLDTVPVGEGWTHAPLGEGWREGRLFGRGANDAKASAAAMIAAMATLARTRPEGLRGEWLVALTACEETSNAGMNAVVAHLGLEHGPGRLAGAVTGEPTGLDVVRAQSGLAVLRAEWAGRSCHAAHVARVPHANALLAAAEEIRAVGPFLTLEPPHPLLGASTIAPTVFRAGERHNVVPDRAEALFDCRLAPPHDARAALELLQRKLPTAKLEVRSARLAAVETAAEHPLVRAALRAAGRGEPIGSSTMSDMALLKGVPCVKCGPGQTARSHTPDEFVLLAELEAGYEFYRTLAPLALEALAHSGVA